MIPRAVEHRLAYPDLRMHNLADSSILDDKRVSAGPAQGLPRQASRALMNLDCVH